MLEVLAKKNAEKVRIIKVDARENNRWAAKHKIRGVPTFLLYRGGVLLNSFVGARPKVEMQEKIDKYSKMFDGAGKASKKDGAKKTKKQPPIQKMSKDWMPPGITKE